MTHLLLGPLQGVLDRVVTTLAGMVAPTSTSPLERPDFERVCVQEDLRPALVRKITAADLRLLASTYAIPGRSKMTKDETWRALVAQEDFVEILYNEFKDLRWPAHTTNIDEPLKTFDEEHGCQSPAPNTQVTTKAASRRAKRKAGRKKRKQQRLDELRRELSRREHDNELRRKAKEDTSAKLRRITELKVAVVEASSRKDMLLREIGLLKHDRALLHPVLVLLRTFGGHRSEESDALHYLPLYALPATCGSDWKRAVACVESLLTHATKAQFWFNSCVPENLALKCLTADNAAKVSSVVAELWSNALVVFHELGRVLGVALLNYKAMAQDEMFEAVQRATEGTQSGSLSMRVEEGLRNGLNSKLTPVEISEIVQHRIELLREGTYDGLSAVSTHTKEWLENLLDDVPPKALADKFDNLAELEAAEQSQYAEEEKRGEVFAKVKEETYKKLCDEVRFLGLERALKEATAAVEKAEAALAEAAK